MRRLIVIDRLVNNWQTLASSLDTDADLLILDSASDGLQQISDYLARLKADAEDDFIPFDSIHIISHGSTGSLLLGSSTLLIGNLNSYAEELRTLGNALSENGDLLLYGCNVAAGDSGLAFINQLSSLTHADVAASVNATGAAVLGGDWILEQTTGNVGSQMDAASDMIELLAANTAPTFVVADGIVTTSIGGSSDDRGNSATVQADGKILVAGYSINNANYFNQSSLDFALIRYNLDGSLDTSFSDDGIVTTAIGLSADVGNSVTLQADGKILVAGSSNNDFALVRYNTDGSLDTSFSNDGIVTSSYGAGSNVKLQADGKILVAGSSINGDNLDFAMVRYDSDGSLDTSFSDDGMLTTKIGLSHDQGYSLALQADGKILVAGTSYNGSGSEFALVRYNTDGSLDTSFSDDGIVTTDIGSSYDYGYSVTLQADGKILVAGSSYNGNNIEFALVRYNPDGGLDSSFSNEGIVTTAIGSSGGQAYSMTLQADGKILVAGFSNNDFTLVSYNPDGSLDSSFSDDGIVTTAIGWSYGNEARSVTLQTDGKILVAGSSYNGSNSDLALVRYNTDGSLDTTFSPPEDTLQQRGSATYFEPIDSWQNSPNVLAPVAQIRDTELANMDNYNGSSLTLARHNNADAQDVFSAKIGGTLSNLVTGSYFSVDGITIGWVSNNADGALTLLFNSNATQTSVNRAMQQVAYSNTSDAPPASVQIDWTFNDGNSGAQGTGGALSVTSSTTVNITPSNDTPYLANYIPDQIASIGSLFDYTIPADIFVDPDLETLSYSITMADGTGIPPWLFFNTLTHNFIGTPTNDDVGSISIRVTVNDSAGGSGFDIYDVFDVFELTISKNAVIGTINNDVLIGTAFTDTLNGLAGNDILIGFAGDDDIDGGADIDTAVYAASRSLYTITQTPSGLIVDDSSGIEGRDTLTNVERLQFADSSLAFDLEGNAGQTYRLYQAALNRTPDPAGLGGWISAMDNGMTLEQVATGFIGSAEFQGLYGANPTHAEFVNLLYGNVLHRAPDQAGFDAWVDLLATQVLTPEGVLIGFSESVENKNALLPAIQEGIVFTQPHQFTGSSAADIIIGTNSSDTLSGLAGNDILIGLAGDDTIDGGADIDTVVYSSGRSTYSISQTDSSLIVVDTSGVEGIDTLTNIERLQFADANLAFDLAGNAGQTYRLYQAAFNRTPDQAGLGYWIHSMDDGMTLQQAATGFMGSAEFLNLYGANPSNGEFINLLYGNVLHRTADQAGYDAWMHALDSGAISREGVLIGFSESNENKIALTGATENGIEYQAWL